MSSTNHVIPAKAGIHKKLFISIFLFLISFCIYYNSLQNGFLFDDKTIVENNPVIKKWGPSLSSGTVPIFKTLSKIFTSNYWANTPYEKQVFLYRPVVMTTFAMDYAIWKSNPFGYHLTNVLINALNSVLLFFFCLMLFRINVVADLGQKILPTKVGNYNTMIVSFLVAILFSVHTIHTEAVNSIVGRTELLSTFFMLLSFMLWKNGTVPKRGLSLFFQTSSLFFFILALLSKESSAVLPVIIFMLVMFDTERISSLAKQKYYNFIYALKKTIPYLIVFIAYFILRSFILKGVFSSGQSGIFINKPFSTVFFTMAKALAYYFRLLVYPVGLSPDYPDFKFSYSLFEPDVLISLFVILSLVAAGFILRKRNKLFSFGIILILISLLPVLNIIVPIGAIIGERFLYFPSIGFCVCLGSIFGKTGTVPERGLSLFSKIWTVPFLILCLWLGFNTMMRNLDWRNDETLWSKTLQYHPTNVKAVYNLAEVEYNKKNYDRAMQLYEKSIIYYPDNVWNADKKSKAVVHYKLGIFYYKQGNMSKAKENFKKTIECLPDYVDAYICLGNCYANTNDLNDAIKHYEKALQIDKDSFIAKENLKRIMEFIHKY